jgi:hypothetical protein
MELLLLLGLGALVLSLTGGKSTAGTPAQDDLKKLYAANPTTYAAVTKLIGNPSPATLNQYAAQLYALYPALAKQLGDMALALVTKVTGKSGTEWYVWVKSKNGNTSYVDVMYGSQPIITYSQEGSDPSKRTYLSTYPGVDATVAKNARADFV